MISHAAARGSRYGRVLRNRNPAFYTAAASVSAMSRDGQPSDQSEAFRLAHRGGGQNKPLYLDHPQFEGFEVRQTVRRGQDGRVELFGSNFAVFQGLFSEHKQTLD
jgi:hypothetical protein